jgi:hypothetical protein
VSPDGDVNAARGRLAWLALAPLSLAAAHLLFTPLYRSNDDVHMDLLLRGLALVSQPDPRIVFSNLLLGRLCVWLYAQAAGLPWYRLIQLALQCLAGTVVVAALVARRRSARAALLVPLYFVVFDLACYVHAQFTVCAATLAAAALLWWHERTGRGAALRAPEVGGVAALVGASAAVRWEATLLVLGLALPLVVLRAAEARRARRLWNHVAAPLGLGALLLVGLVVHDYRSYRAAPGWEAFHLHNWLRGEFIDFQRGRYDEGTRAIFERVGWSANDLAMLKEWFFVDRELYSIEKFRAILDALPPRAAAQAGERAARLREAWSDELYPPMLLAALVPLLLGPRSRRGWLALALTFGAAAATAGWLLLVLRDYPPRVAQPTLAFLCLAGIALGAREPSLRRGARARGALALVLALGAGCWAVVRLEQHSRLAGPLSRALLQALERLERRPNELYVVWGAEFPYELLPPLGRWEELRGLNLLGLGTDSSSPRLERRLAQFGIDDLYRALYTRDDVRLISRPRLNELFVRWVAEHHGVRIVPRLVADLDTSRFRLFQIYRFERAGPAHGAD